MEQVVNEYRDLLDRLERMNCVRTMYFTVRRFVIYLKDRQKSIYDLTFADGHEYLNMLKKSCSPLAVNTQKSQIKRFYASVTGKTDLFTDGRKDTPVFDIRFSDPLVREYVKSLSDYSQNTRIVKETILSSYCGYLKKIEKRSAILTLEELNRFVKEYYHSRKTINRGVTCLNLYYRYLARAGEIDKSPFETEKPPVFSAVFGVEAEYYLRLCKAQNTGSHSLRSISNSLRILDRFLQERGLDCVEKAGREDGRDFMIHLSDRKKANGSPYYHTTSVNRILSNIRAFLNSLGEKGNICSFGYGLWTLKMPSGFTRNIFSRKELSELFRFEAVTTLDFMYKTLFVCQYATGLRIGELLSLNRSDIDFDRKTLLINESKTKKQRFVHIGEAGIRYLKIYLEQVRAPLNRSEKLHERVFVTQYIDTTPGSVNINAVLKRICRKMGIKKEVSTHCFRHSYATHLLENGADIKKIAELLGHSNLASSEKYTRLSPVHLQRILSRCHPREKEGQLWS
jgi:integrase/recombinase XerC